MAHTVTVGLLGLGNVGGGLIELVRRNSAVIAERSGVEIRIKRALVRDTTRPRPVHREFLTTRPEEILDDPEIDVVVEVMGGIEPARKLLLQAIERGKSVVTANKAVLALYGDEIFQAASDRRCRIGFEASVCGGIPIIRALTEGLVANRIEQLCGIVNGTTNYILTKMHEEGLPFADALRRAQELGLAEPDPTLDVKGIDAAQKLVILAGLAFHVKASVQEIGVEGIDTLDVEDIRTAKEFGYTIKLVALGQKQGEQIDLRVHPALIPNTHPLANVRHEYNAVFLRGDAIGEMVFYGRGAGSLPTASAVLSDIVQIAHAPSLNGWRYHRRVRSTPVESDSRYYLRFPIYDLPGVIGLITTALGNHGISITHALATLREDPRLGNVKILTHRAAAGVLRRALDEIARLPVLHGKPVAIRILE